MMSLSGTEICNESVLPLPNLDVKAGERVVVAMSGGVDSSVAAAVCKEQGYDVIGITLQLYDYGKAAGRKGACCAGQDIHDARRVAQNLGIPHYVLDFETRFHESVIEEFADTYLGGETPIPCVLCNQTVKFSDLLSVAKSLNAQALVTGHYVRRVTGLRGVEMHVSSDLERDQSYFLFGTTRKQLSYLRFPLGGLLKAQTRLLAKRFDLAVANKADSQDICFVPNGSYADVIEKLRPGAIEPGEIIDINGNIVGYHEGVINFTIGQRRGLRLGGKSEPFYVLRLNPEQRQVIVGPRQALGRSEFEIRNLNWLWDDEEADVEFRAKLRIRSGHSPVAGVVRQNGCDKAWIKLDEPEVGIAPGQACVIYRKDRVLGGGWIVRG